MNGLTRHLASHAARLRRCRTQLSVPAAFVRHNSTDSNAPSSSDALPPHGQETSLEGLESPYPDLMQPDIIMDLHEAQTFAPSRRTPFQNKVIIRNDPSMFTALRDQAKLNDPFAAEQASRARKDTNGPLTFLHLTPAEISRLYRYPILRRRVVQQTGKGKIPRQHVVMVVGNQNGLVGIGEGKADEAQRASQAALKEAVRNMDYIERFEARTVWTEMESKFGSTRIILRPRPVGFGLRCNPNIYQILKAAGIKDVSAKVWGSRNPLQVVRALMRMLMPGNSPLGMGNGVGGKGRRMDKGAGLRAQDELERERGRKLVPLRL
ncbi:uncharacterized protein FIBRA_01605 [Fibroporia radiculosa]|uniref:Small ribosomal subunit protein uS5m n=1 Tax=Fibroporia radiculosa TaxID=599839 RepID=J4HTL5_9APHY|nr:uncharacterized protein FIBRA_01605 [Fibroporia radiculosa]CCL99587.1 predicted protein [Fibroporia radiculosa]